MAKTTWLLTASIVLMIILACFAFTAESQTCSMEGDVRIFKTSTFVSGGNGGRVEICHNSVWGTIGTGDSRTIWSEKNALVACRQAGFRGAINSVFVNELPLADKASSSTPVHYHSVRCVGSESGISSCSLSDDTSSYNLSSPNTYQHALDAFVVCQPNNISYSAVHFSSPKNGEIRLHSDAANGQGAVEIYTTQYGWSSICPDGFDNSDAGVLCRRLGYAGGTSQSYSVGSTARPRYVHDADCGDSGSVRGLSTTVTNAGVCSFVVNLANMCPSGSALYAGVRCISEITSEGAVRLFGGSEGTAGVLEVFFNNKWGMVCNGGTFNTEEATTVCRQLGYDPSQSTRMTPSTSLLQAESNVKPIWLTKVMCTDNSVTFLQCNHGSEPVGYGYCTTSSNIVAVTCVPFKQLSTGEIIGIIIGVPAGLIIIFIITWFAGLNKHWANRRHNPHYKKFVSCLSACKSVCKRSDRVRHHPCENIPVQQVPPPAATVTSPTEPTALATPEAEPKSEPHPENQEFTKVAPPSYRVADSYPVSGATPQDFPPPYSGQPTFEYPLAPPSSNPAYPPQQLPYPT